MASEQAGSLLRHVRSLISAEATRALTDAQLLQRFVTYREESAFAPLLRRHSSLVWRVCRRVLHNEQDAEDAFQATFLVLARRASSIRKDVAVGSWLYSVAYRIAMK